LANSQIEKMFGYTKTELLGQPIEILVPERARAQHVARREIFLSQPTARPMGSGGELYGLRKDGSEFPLEIGLNPLQTGGQSLILASVIDITERKQAESALRESEERLARTEKFSLVMATHADLEGRWLKVPPTLCEFARLHRNGAPWTPFSRGDASRRRRGGLEPMRTTDTRRDKVV
ncbi:MAG TPA: PAS domain S-box protein, partial [Candidatus Binatia bacterium]|nr:PAS domain S-box protein [Candidatus Binatia bacterium]